MRCANPFCDNDVTTGLRVYTRTLDESELVCGFRCALMVGATADDPLLRIAVRGQEPTATTGSRSLEIVR